MASRFLRRSKPKPPLNQDSEQSGRSITQNIPKKLGASLAGVPSRKTENPSLPVAHNESSKVVPRDPRPVPSNAKSVQPTASDRTKELEPIIQTTLPLDNVNPSASVRETRLRRKQSSADNRSLYTRSKSQSSSPERRHPPPKHPATSVLDERGNANHETALGISMPIVSQSTSQLSSISQTPTEFATSNSRMAKFMSRQLPHKLSTHDLAPPTPGFATKSSSASTRCSTTSPSPFSRVSTPTSTSSYSPAIHLSATRSKQTPSPARLHPPITRRRGTDLESHELSALEESSISTTTPAVIPETMVSNFQEGKAASNFTSSRMSAGAPIPPLRFSSKRLPRPKPEPVLSPTPATSKSSAKTSSLHEERVGHAKAILKQQASLTHVFENPRQPPPRPGLKHTSESTVEPQYSIADETGPVGERDASFQASTAYDTNAQIEPVANQSQNRPLPLRSQTTSTSSRIPTRSPLINSNGVPAVKPPFRSVTPSNSLLLKPEGPKKLVKSTSRERAVSPARSTSRLSIFSRRTRQGSNGADTAELPIKKGPAAGTGHEGYGKYARRGRTSSIGTASSRGRSTSDESGSEFSYPARSTRKSSFASQSSSELDDFYKERLQPVIIRGGSRVEESKNNGSGFYQVESGRASKGADSSVESLPERRPSQRTPIKLGLPVSPRDTDVMKRFPPRASTLPEGADEQLLGAEPPQPTLAARRSFNRLQNGTGLEPLKVPPPIDVSVAQVSPSLGSFETTLSDARRTDSSIFSDDILEAPATGSWSKARRLLDRAKTSKRNFLRHISKTPGNSQDYQSEMEAHELFAAVSEVPDYRAVAHYCMLDDPDQEVKETLEDLLHEIEDDLELHQCRDTNDRECESSPFRHPSILLPSPPEFPRDASPIGVAASITIPLQAEEQSLSTPISQSCLELSLISPKDSEPIASPIKTPRLAQVGRIPKIVSKKDHMHKPPPRSFSRPFQREEYPSVANANLPAEKAVSKPQDVKKVEFEAGPVFKQPDPVAGAALRFSPEKDYASVSSRRKRSGLSDSTNSSGMLDFSAITAIRPDSTASLDEDEIWNEYDELFERAVFPYTSTTGFSLVTDPAFNPKPDTLTTNFGAVQDALVTRYSIVSDPLSPKSTSRTQQLSGTLPKLPTPPPQPDSAPNAVDFTGAKPIVRLDSTSSKKSHHSHLSKTSSQSSRSSRRSTRPRTLSQILERKSRQSSSSVHHALRYHAVMISQYLSFSRVLFSPVHTEVSTHMSEKVLVLDGLGNDDWSLYCALKYPEAIIYNLGASRPPSLQRRDSAVSTSLPNHRQIQHIGIANPFPFPKGFFAAVVWRFPATNSEATYYNAISEAKRVLRPGGYLELTILDMDPVNMGNRARRAVRGLKVSMQASNPELSLAPAGDSIQKLLGRKGFENLSRCVVGIPVVGGFGGGEPSESQEAMTTSTARENHGLDMATAPKDLSSLDDVSMLQAVGSVGRWWWSRCFEHWGSKDQAADESEPRGSSIWDEPALLKECEERETSLKLLLCYAQKPAMTRRRTVSV